VGLLAVCKLAQIWPTQVAALHLPKLGAKLTVLTGEQAAYINVPVNGPFKVRARCLPAATACPASPLS
jgi:S-adenosyl-L-homocysteine hydrolase